MVSALLKWIILFLLVLVTMSNSDVRAQSDVPFIYYYSSADSAFVIERADGTDREILVEYALPEARFGRPVVGGAGWSPSGRWFAWDARDTEDGNFLTLPKIINRNRPDNIIELSALTDPLVMNYGVNYAWSPTDDLLLVTYVSNDSVEPAYVIFVYNPAENQKLFEIKSGFSRLAHWSPSGDYIVQYGRLEGQCLMRIIRLDSTAIERALHPAHCDYRIPTFWTISNDVAYIIESGVVVFEDTNQNQSRYEIDEEMAFIEWSGSGQYSLVHQQASVYQLSATSLFSQEDKTLTSLLANAMMPELFFYYYSDLAPDYLNQYDFLSLSSWSSLSDAAALLSSDHELLIWTPSEVTTVALPVDKEIMLLEWGNENEVYLLLQEEDSLRSEVLRYDLNTQTLETILNLETRLGYIHVSPDYQYLAYGTQPFYIYHLPTGERREVKVYTTHDDLYPDAVFWHPTESWIFLLSRYSTDTVQVNIANISDTNQRALGECNFSPGCFGWLPDNVRP